MNDTYGIYHWRILWSSCKRLAWVRFEPKTNEFHSDSLTDWAIRSWIQLTLRANFVQLLHFYRFFSVKFLFGYCLHQLPRFFLIVYEINQKFLENSCYQSYKKVLKKDYIQDNLNTFLSNFRVILKRLIKNW